VRDLNVGELWANYSISYTHSSLGDLTRSEFTLWPNNYLKKTSTKDDLEPKDSEIIDSYIMENVLDGRPKFFS
jgi:hypothetical protein